MRYIRGAKKHNLTSLTTATVPALSLWRTTVIALVVALVIALVITLVVAAPVVTASVVTAPVVVASVVVASIIAASAASAAAAAAAASVVSAAVMPVIVSAAIVSIVSAAIISTIIAPAPAAPAAAAAVSALVTRLGCPALEAFHTARKVVTVASITPPVPRLHLNIIKIATAPSLHLTGNFDSKAASSELLAVHFRNCVIRITSISILDKSKSRRLVGHPNFSNFAELSEAVAEFLLLD